MAEYRRRLDRAQPSLVTLFALGILGLCILSLSYKASCKSSQKTTGPVGLRGVAAVSGESRHQLTATIVAEGWTIQLANGSAIGSAPTPLAESIAGLPAAAEVAAGGVSKANSNSTGGAAASGVEHGQSNNSSSIRLFVGVLTAAKNRDRRDAVRQTWGSDPRLVRVVFVVARPVNQTLQRAVQEEASQHHDILYLGQIQEHYRNITHQTLEIFRAASLLQGHVTHVLKCDDDTFLNVDRLFKFLSGLPRFRNYIGAFTEYVPHRNSASRWNAPYEIWPETQPKIRYALGIGYVLTMDLVEYLATGGATGYDCKPGPLFWYEDVAVGHWLLCLQQERGWNVTFTSSESRFTHWGCVEGSTISHHLMTSQLRCMYARGGRCCSVDEAAQPAAAPTLRLSSIQHAAQGAAS